MSNTPNPPKFSISIGNGTITVEAPTKQECIELLKEAAQIKSCSPISEAIR